MATLIFKKSNTNVQLLFGKLLQARNEIHLYHLRCRTLSEHLATDDLYKGLLEYADNIFETYQGETQSIVSFEVPISKCPINIIDYLKSLSIEINDAKSLFKSDIQNIIDELVASINKAIYKLTFLK